MVSGSRMEGGTQILPARVRKTIQSIKEIVGNHSDADIYVTLRETNMDPNETTQKLLYQDPFHEVKRKRDKKKESTGYKRPTEPRIYIENVGQGKFRSFPDRNVRRGGYSRSTVPDAGIGREFRVVRDNRVNQNTNRDMKPVSPQLATSVNEQVISNISEKGNSTGTSNNQKPSSGRQSSQSLNGPTDARPGIPQDANSSGSNRKELLEERQATIPNAVSRVQAVKPNDSQPYSASLASNSSVVGVYSSSSDPVHVPSPDSRSSAIVGAIKREVGVVGVRRQSTENSVKHSSAPSSSLPSSLLGRENSPSTEPFRPFNAIPKSDQPRQTTVPDHVIPSMPVNRSFLGNQYGSRPHQQPVGHQKAPQPNKEWKPKSSQKSSHIIPGVIGTPAKSVSPRADNSKDLESETAKLQDKLSQASISENQNVIIAQHIRVPETDRCRLTFGSFGADFASGFQAVGNADEPSAEPSASLSVSPPESSSDDGSKQVDLDDQYINSGTASPESGEASEHQLPDKKESSSPQNLENYADIGLVRESSPSYTPESQQQQERHVLPSFPHAYDPQAGYDIPYFRPTMDETVRGQGLPSPQEALASHTANSIPASSIAMVQQQQQQPPVPQMYQQVHVPHFANLMPYRQFLSPVYVPPMAMPGYSSNPAYSHPSNANSYLLMPGGSSHLGANGLNATGLEDSSRLKYKDGNIYVPNPQAETSEIWIQNPRELPGLQSAPYYNMPAQTPHAAYMPSHTGHASFNAAAAAAQSSHMQFPGLYHPPPQPAAMASPHHLGPPMGGNVGVGVAAAAPGPQVGAYQQPQLGHLNWTTNF
ncbi:GBF-interacting protein 1-like isoform X5 [Vitis vinifera]|uniref:GBF-interacting protein 1-like isoform X5 n=1 Tax=Vitis vinifera TaxID=29760 RepID=UPI00053F8F19|nr:GBF-interacting protein 1-like isoform X5 [Vitis vinifera]|eukprot:XP_010654471.1 PREDICTED: GBF-interacting protein 1-like isoform X4 [Vitis vinifera]